MPLSTPEQLISQFLKDTKKADLPPLIVLLGPTASGKTALSIKLAKQFSGEIISADSRQIYQQIDISTDKITEKDKQEVQHHLMNFVPLDQVYSVAEFQDQGFKIINEILNRQKLPFLVGGTGLYIEAITENYLIPRIPPNLALREQLMTELKEQGELVLYQRLQKLDQASASKLNYKNHRYLIRALEISLSGQKKDHKKGDKKYAVLKIGLTWPREKLYQRINHRVDLQVERGLINEVKKVVKQYGEKVPAITALGLRQLLPYLKGESALNLCLDRLKQETRNYAKRQITWFKRDPEIHWFNGEELF